MGSTKAAPIEISLTEESLTKSPFELFQRWLHIAEKESGFFDPNAMCLSTVGEDGYPDSRMVLLKGLDERGFVFFTNSTSRKGRALALNPRAALNFYWDPLRIQVRVQGDVAPVSKEESDEYFATRPRLSQLGAWTSRQSTELSSRAEFEARIAELERQYEGQEIPRPEHWYGYRVSPVRIEFWKDRRNRLHDRFEYLLEGGAWRVRRLYP
jgi:pyridoxamine 5'-phosphate oxidase